MPLDQRVMSLHAKWPCSEKSDRVHNITQTLNKAVEDLLSSLLKA
jgi:hypothetical protein